MIADRIRSIQAVSGGGGGGATDPYYAYRSLILNFDGDFNDSSPNPITVTPYGDSQIVNSGQLFGSSCLQLDGSGDYLKTVNNQALNMGSGDFTVEFWLYIDSSSSTYKRYFSIIKDTTISSQTYESVLFESTNLVMAFAVRLAGSFATASDTTALSLNTWYHFAGVRRNGVLTLYKNGVAVGSSPVSGAVNFDSDYVAVVGRWLPSADRDIYGKYNSLRISPWAVYTSNFTPSQDLFPDVQGYPAYDPRNSLLLNMQGTAGGTTFIDESPNAFTVTRVGDAVLVSDATFGTAASFDGAGDYLSISSNAAFNFGTGDFTVEAWINPALSTGVTGVCATSGGSGGTSKFVVHLNNRVPSIHYQGLTNGSNIYTTATAAVAQSQWSHIAFCRAGATWKWFINGVQSGSGTNATNIIFTTQPSYIGYGGESYFTPFNGKIGPLRITKGVARYTANFTPPTGLFPTS